MLTKGFRSVVLLLIGMFSKTLGTFVGVNIGTEASNLPSDKDIALILKSHEINHVRLFNADHGMLKALSRTGIEVMVSVTNEEVLGIGESAAIAVIWVKTNIVPYLPLTNITTIAVGNEILSSIPNLSQVLVGALKNLHSALVYSNLNYIVKLSSPQSMKIIPKSFPPSLATFNSTLNSTIYELLQFLKSTNSSYMLNAYPYFEYTNGDGIFPLDYALFNSLPPMKQIVDPNTAVHYSNMFDAMIDSAYYSIESFNISGIPIIVTECGWPWHAGNNEPDATVENAGVFNNNLIKRVLNNSGPPSKPSIPINTYVYELFNENRQGSFSKRDWGWLFTNGTAAFAMSLNGTEQVVGNSSGSFCVAKSDSNLKLLGDGLSWACGSGKADCSSIQRGNSCYLPNTLQSHASFAYNDYYHKTHVAGGTCDFKGTAMLVSIDPSKAPCIYTGSPLVSNTSKGFTPSQSLGPSADITGGNLILQVHIFEQVLVGLFALVFF